MALNSFVDIYGMVVMIMVGLMYIYDCHKFLQSISGIYVPLWVILFIFVPIIWNLIVLKLSLSKRAFNEIWTSLFDYFGYNYILYYIFGINKYPLSMAYKLNFQYGNIYQCNICLNDFNLNTNQYLLHCGHRFCCQCLNDWELEQRMNTNNYYSIDNIDNVIYGVYPCPQCQIEYDNSTKWTYKYCIN